MSQKSSMTHILQDLTSIGNGEWKPIIKIKDLIIGKKYKLYNIKVVQTNNFGRKIVVETEENCIFLPERYSKAYNDKKINELTSLINKIALVYKGEMNVGEENTMAKIAFVSAE